MLKSESVKEPTKYLGAEIQKYNILGNTDLNSKECWAMSSDKYVKHAIAHVELELAQNNQQLQTNVHTPLSSGYHPELDSSPAQHANYYEGLIGALQWIVELGKMDIHVPVAHMSQYLMLPCRGQFGTSSTNLCLSQAEWAIHPCVR